MVLTTYTTPQRVANLMQFSSNFSGTVLEAVQDEIVKVEARIDNVLHESWRIVQVENEYHNIVPAHLHDFTFGPGWKISLNRSNLVTSLTNIEDLDTGLGDKIEIWDGNSYVDYLTARTQGRNNDYWVDAKEGVLYVRNVFFGNRGRRARITYRTNSGSRTLINDSGDLSASATSVTVDGTTNFPLNGVVKIEDEYVSYTGKTSTTLTGLGRGEYNTTGAIHVDNVAITFVPGDIEQVAALMAGVALVRSDDRSVSFPESASDNVSLTDKSRDWENKIERILNDRKPVIVYSR